MTRVVRPIEQPLERCLDQPLGFGIERRSRLVEQQQGRVAQQRPGDRDALALAAGQPCAAFAEIGVEAFGQLAQELGRIGRFRRFPELVVARVPQAVAQIVARRGGEDDRLLRHEGDPRAHVGRIGLAQVDAVEPDRADLRIVEALGELEQGRLAGARRTDHRQRLARTRP